MESGSAQEPQTPRGGENHLRVLIDYVSDALSVVDLTTGRYLDVNRHKCESLGYTREEMLAIRVEDIDPDLGRSENLRRFMTEIRPGRPVTFKTRHLRKDGSSFPVEVRCDLIEMDGRTCLLGVARDITERERTEELLELNEARAKALLQLNEMHDASLHELAHYAMEEAVKLTRSELGYLAFGDESGENLVMYAWSESAMAECAVQDKPITYPLAETGLWGEAVRQRQPVITNDYPAPNPHKKGIPQGHVHLIRHMNVPVFDGDRIAIVAGVGNKETDYDQSDVMQLQLLMDGLWRLLQKRESEARYRLIVENQTDMIVKCDRQGRITFASPSYCRTFGQTSESLHETEFFRSAAPKNREIVADALRTALKRPYRATTQHRVHTSRSVRWHEWAYSGVADEKGVVDEIIISGRDVTDVKKAHAEHEKLIRKLETQNAELERFTYTVSHDLKTPLITIRGYLGLLEEDIATQDFEAAEGDIQRIVRATDTMKQLLDELLELSRIGRLMNPTVTASLNDIIGEALENAAGRIAQVGCKVEVASDLPLVHGDRQRIVEVFQNLIDNAAKYATTDTAPRIEIGIEHRNVDTLLFVRDNGIGIDPNYHENVFGLFNQLDPKSEGTGVGLAIVKRIVEVHGGRIWVESEGRGKGTTFYLTLPVTAPIP